MLIYGRNAVIETLHEGQVRRLLVAKGVKPGFIKVLEREARRSAVDLEFVARIDLDRAVATTRHQGVAAELPEVSFSEPDEPFALAERRQEQPLLVVLDHITDPRNYGAIIRSTEVLGGHGVVTEARNSAPLSAVVAKTAAGATSYLPLLQVTNLVRYLGSIKDRGVWVYGADQEASAVPAMLDWNRPLALVIGSEGRGLRRLVRETCDELVAIPQSGRISSLNASVAAGILLYQAGVARQVASEGAL